MKNILTLLSLFVLFTGCENSKSTSTHLVADKNELYQAINNVQPGDILVLANGEWKDVRIRLVGNGTKEKPITLRAETPGDVVI